MHKKRLYGSQLELLVENGVKIQEFFKDGRLFQKQLRTNKKSRGDKINGFSPGHGRWNLM